MKPITVRMRELIWDKAGPVIEPWGEDDKHPWNINRTVSDLTAVFIDNVVPSIFTAIEGLD